ncbi:MAG: DJ-1/PfpI family protein [Pseudomonadota bacterium]|nr:DJ-1/PfpI family protein [Pseudomonadota bacterium]
MAKSVGIFIFDEVDILDFSGPYEVFSRTRTKPGIESRKNNNSAPFNVFTISKTQKTIQVSGGLQVLADYSFKNSPKIDILLIPGGLGTRPLLQSKETISWILDVAEGASLLTSVCTGSLLLAQAGLLENKTATTHWGALDLLKNLSPSTKIMRDQRVVDDGIITSAGVSSGIDMAFQVVAKLFGDDIAADTAKYIEYQRTTEILPS